eukprot:489807-Pyramimonas_sp.AAC.1
MGPRNAVLGVRGACGRWRGGGGRRGEENAGQRLFKTRTQHHRMVGEKIILAKVPTICSCGYRDCEYLLQ